MRRAGGRTERQSPGRYSELSARGRSSRSTRVGAGRISAATNFSRVLLTFCHRASIRKTQPDAQPSTTRMDFKVPSLLPQDLQLIQDLVGEIPPPTPPLRLSKSASPVPLVPREEDSIDSSDESDNDSEREVEADILAGLDDDEDENSPHVKWVAAPLTLGDNHQFATGQHRRIARAIRTRRRRLPQMTRTKARSFNPLSRLQGKNLLEMTTRKELRVLPVRIQTRPRMRSRR